VVDLKVLINDAHGVELTRLTSIAALPDPGGTYDRRTVSKTVAAFELDKIYRAQFRGTMQDAGLNDVDYYEKLTLIGVAS
jgi:hypothetical protein